MIVAKPELIFKEMREKEMPFWHILRHNTEKEVAANMNKDVPLEESVMMLKETLESLSGDTVDVIVSERTKEDLGKGGNIKNIKRQEYTVKLNGIDVSGIGSVKSANDPIFQLMKQNYDLQLMFEKLSWEKNNSGDAATIAGVERIVDRLDKYLPQIFGFKNVPILPQVNGLPTATTKEEAAKQLQESIDKISKIDPDVLDTLSRFATLAETKPDVYKMVVAQLKGS